ncbi:MAG: dTDP-4-dehydrorhamnose 3,5-epimerase [Gammaproteobacteria bacterium]|nr:dTDP-4-dehydrorhamnose 3,5-epimerase [Gammaproteobacteria bacterium]
MKFTPTRISDVVVVDPEVHEDGRGFFMETWHERLFDEVGIHARFVQDNYTRSSRGTLRGLHYQVKKPQGKLIRVVVGEAFDVAVDLRQSSPTFGQWAGETLSAANKRSIWIPPGFAHGFIVTGDSAEMVYRCTDYYSRQHERTLRWDDKDLAIDWPLTGIEQPVLSAKDAAGASLKDADVYA